MTTPQKVPTVKVLFLSDWKELGHRSLAGHWIVLRQEDNPQERLIATYANLVGRKDLIRGIGKASIQTIITAIAAGLPTESVDKVKDLIGVNRGMLSRILNVSPRTLSRRQTLKPAASERLFRVSGLFQKALEVLGDRSEAQRWFTTPKKALGGSTPFEYSETEVGAGEVGDLLGRIEYGVYS
jgi:putative toxin-antitoxin system antitoxin component (TIGR02293 family)